MLEFKNISKSYKNNFFDKNQIHVLQNISFKLKKGEILGLHGKSGSGKTTIARIALKLTSPSSGKVIFNGKDITLVRESKFRSMRSRIQILFQHPEDAFNPDILVMDEPTSMLDVSEQAHVLQLIKQRCKKMNMGAILISHDPHVITAMCNRVIKISKGCISEEAPMDQGQLD